MVLLEDGERIKHLLAEAISVLCKNGLDFRSELTVEGLLGITLDNSDIFLVNIHETINKEVRVCNIREAVNKEGGAGGRTPQGSTR